MKWQAFSAAIFISTHKKPVLTKILRLSLFKVLLNILVAWLSLALAFT